MNRFVGGVATMLCLWPGIIAAQPVETEIPGVTAELVELRQAGGALRLLVRLTNAGGADAEPDRFSVEGITLVETRSKKKHFALMDAARQYIAGPIGDSIDGGRIRLVIPARQTTILWAYFEPLASGSVVDVNVPLMFPFSNVPVADGAGKTLTSNGARSIPGGAAATVVSATRANQTMTVRLRLAADRGAQPEVGPYFTYKDVFLYDPAGKRKYPLLQDPEGQFQGQPNTTKMDGGSFILDWSKTNLVTLLFPAPPDTVASVDLLLPWFLPIEGMKIEGAGGAATGGVAAAGRNLGLEGALKELNAEVTPSEIRIALSADVLFDLDKAVLKPAAEETLTHLLVVANSKPESHIGITGHTDIRGDAAYNQALSERRAESVRAWLVAHRVASARISAEGAGKTRPLRLGSTEADHRANRRVEIRIASSR